MLASSSLSRGSPFPQPRKISEKRINNFEQQQSSLFTSPVEPECFVRQSLLDALCKLLAWPSGVCACVCARQAGMRRRRGKRSERSRTRSFDNLVENGLSGCFSDRPTTSVARKRVSPRCPSDSLAGRGRLSRLAVFDLILERSRSLARWDVLLARRVKPAVGPSRYRKTPNWKE